MNQRCLDGGYEGRKITNHSGADGNAEVACAGLGHMANGLCDRAGNLINQLMRSGEIELSTVDSNVIDPAARVPEMALKRCQRLDTFSRVIVLWWTR